MAKNKSQKTSSKKEKIKFPVLRNATKNQKAKRKTSNHIPADVWPRAICAACTNEWEPNTLEPSRGNHYCPHCGSTETLVYDADKKQLNKLPSMKTKEERKKEKKRKAKEKKKKDPEVEFVPFDEYDIEDENEEDETIDDIVDNIEDDIKRGSHVKLRGVGEFPELEVETKITIISEARKNEWRDIDDYVFHLLKWSEVEKELGKLVGKQNIHPETFVNVFKHTLKRAAMVEKKEEEVQKLRTQLKDIEMIREELDSIVTKERRQKIQEAQQQMNEKSESELGNAATLFGDF